MSFLENLHAEHKARQRRLGLIPSRVPAPKKIEPPAMKLQPPAMKLQPSRVKALPPVDPTFFYPRMWFWDLVNPPPPRPSEEPWHITIRGVQEVICAHFKLTRTELLSKRRTRGVVYPRQVAMYFSKKLTVRSLPEIGRHFGGLDHTTVLHAVRKIDALAKSDWRVAFDLAHVELRL